MLKNVFEIERKESFSAPNFPDSKIKFKNVSEMELKQQEDIQFVLKGAKMGGG